MARTESHCGWCVEEPGAQTDAGSTSQRVIIPQGSCNEE